MKKGDIALVLTVLAIIAGIFAFNKFNYRGHKGDLTAIINKDNNVIRTIDLSLLTKTETITVQGKYKATIIAQKDRIRVLDSTCPDKICVKSGWLTKPGDSSVCVPNRLIVSIKSRDNSEVDTIAK